MLSDVAACLRFYSRLRIPALPGETGAHSLPDFRRLAPVVPVAGLVIGLLPAAVLVLAVWVQLSHPLSAILCVATAVVITGGFHEDGLADTADSFGASTPERRLEIMRDSRIGTFGAAALALSLAARVAVLAQLLALVGTAGTALAVVAWAATARTAALPMMVLLPSARVDGTAYAVGAPTRSSVGVAVVVSAVVVLAVGASTPVGVLPAAAGLAGSFAAGLAVTLLAGRHVGGHSGDMAGAAEQCAEIAGLVAVIAVLQI